MSLVERIKVLAQKNGLNIKTLEQTAGLGNGTIRRWDNSPPSADKLLKIAYTLNTTCEFLLTGTDISSVSFDDKEWLSLIHQLPREAQLEFKGELKGYIKHMNESVAADSSKTGTDNLGK